MLKVVTLVFVELHMLTANGIAKFKGANQVFRSVEAFHIDKYI
jgi:hypothetical protein